jgi:hypothetical protein
MEESAAVKLLPKKWRPLVREFVPPLQQAVWLAHEVEPEGIDTLLCLDID